MHMKIGPWPVIGLMLPDNEPALQVILDLKDIVELIVAPINRPLHILRARFLNTDTVIVNSFLMSSSYQIIIIYLEHYPQMICCFRPLIGLWAMRFEDKHSFFKKVAQYTNCLTYYILSVGSSRHMSIYQ